MTRPIGKFASYSAKEAFHTVAVISVLQKRMSSQPVIVCAALRFFPRFCSSSGEACPFGVVEGSVSLEGALADGGREEALKWLQFQWQS